MHRRSLLALAGAPAFALPALAQAPYPSRPVTWIVPFPPGGSADASGRFIAAAMSRQLGQQIVIDNRAGAGGILGSDIVAKARPDGYTLLWGSSAPIAIAPAITRRLPYDPMASFIPIQAVWESPLILVVRANSPFRTLADLLAEARRRPGDLTYGSGTAGAASNIVGEQVQHAAGITLTNVPYRGMAQATTDLIAGQIDMVFDYAVQLRGHVEAGTLIALATTGPRRPSSFPTVPTLAELGLGEAGITAWAGLLAPAQTPPAVIERLNRAFAQIMRDPEVIAYYEANGATGTPEAHGDRFRAMIAAEIAKTQAVVDRIGFVPE